MSVSEQGSYHPKGNAPKGNYCEVFEVIPMALACGSKNERTGQKEAAANRQWLREAGRRRLQLHSPCDTRYGGFIAASTVSSTSQKGFSSKTSVYSVTPSDHISSSGPLYL